MDISNDIGFDAWIHGIGYNDHMGVMTGIFDSQGVGTENVDLMTYR